MKDKKYKIREIDNALILIDLLSLCLGFALAHALRFNEIYARFAYTNFEADTYQRLMLALVLIYFLVHGFFLDETTYLIRSVRREALNVLKMVLLSAAFLLIYMFFSKSSEDYSRSFVLMFSLIAAFLDFCLRMLLKRKILPFHQRGKSSEKMVMVGDSTSVLKCLKQMREVVDFRQQIVGLIITDKSLIGSYIDKIKVIGDSENIFDTLKEGQVDSVFLVQSPFELHRELKKKNLQDEAGLNFDMTDYASLVESMYESGKKIYINIDEYEFMSGMNRDIINIGGSMVVNCNPDLDESDMRKVVVRLLDVAFAIALMPILVLVMAILKLISLASGEKRLMIRSLRIGRNGRRFYQHRFKLINSRGAIEALESKESSEAKEKSEARESSENKDKDLNLECSKVGRLILALRLHKLPEIIDCLEGSMSFVGPYAPSLQRYMEFNNHARSNLVYRPGIFNWGKFETTIPDFGESLNDELELEAIFINNQRKAKRPYLYETSGYKPAGSKAYHAFKRCMDILISLSAIIVLSPLFLILSFLVFIDDGGNPFYGHSRIGLKGKRIKIFKFRTMREDASELEKFMTKEQIKAYKKEFKLNDDPRVTLIGRFLRKSSLDELPQLFNILFGHLSLIGPRPIVEDELKMYGSDVEKLLSIKPGLTGYWQAYARNNASYADGKRQAMELKYVSQESLAFDFKIFFKTFARVISQDGVE